MAASPSIMPAEAGSWLSRRIIGGVIALFGIAVVTVALLLSNYYWPALIFFFAGLLLVVGLCLKKYQRRNLLLLLIAASFILVAVGTLTYDFWRANPDANPFPGNDPATILAAALVGVGAALILIVIPFLWLVGIATAGILKWYENSGDISFFDAYLHLLTDVLGILRVSVIVDDEKPRGRERDLKVLETFGGPGLLTVYPGRVVVLHKWGKVTRGVGLGSTVLERGEQIKAILPLGGQGGPNLVENVFTKDKVPLTVTVFHSAQMETAQETEGRGGQVKDDKKIGDDYDQCYESVAKRVATKAPKIGDALKSPVAGNLRTAIMAYNFDQLFDTNISTKNLNIEQIKSAIFDGAKGAGVNNGILLKRVDITEMKFPEEIGKKLNQEIAAHVDSRIKQEEAQTVELTAISAANTAKHQANATLTLAQADRDAERFRAEAHANHYNQIIQALQNRGQSEETIRSVLEKLSSSNTTQEEYNRLLETMTHYIRGERTGNGSR